jgi:hypothetical protein
LPGHWLKSFAERSREPELIDGDGYGVEEYRDCLADLRRINRYLGGQRVIARHLFPMIESVVGAGDGIGAGSDGSRSDWTRPVRLLDVGTGSADLPVMVVEWCRARRIAVEFTVIDFNRLATIEARDFVGAYPEIRVVRADAFRLPFVDGAFDFALASLFLHHFDDAAAARLLSGLASVARVAFLINDLRRHPVAYYGIMLLTQIFTRNRLVRHDAAVSVLRGFGEGELERIAMSAGVKAGIHRHFPYRYLMTGVGGHERGRGTEGI